MRLSGRGVRCIRGGREVLSGLDFDASAGEALAVTGANGAGKTSLLRLIAGLLAASGGSVDLTGGDGELTLAEQAHYLGHRDALKPSLSVKENLSFWGDFLGPGTSRICRRLTCPPGNGGGCRSGGFWPCKGRSGCWTSPHRRWMPPARTCSRA
jgi:ABC-type transport system involved in cytochrome c biogenesis ATPase subunit